MTPDKETHLVIQLQAAAQMRPRATPPRATTKKERSPMNTSTGKMLSLPMVLNVENMLYSTCRVTRC